MFDWMKYRGTPGGLHARTDQASLAAAGEYKLLYEYLRDRHANRVVLTFVEVEDLIGFPLPAPAREQRAWWRSVGSAAGDAAPGPQSVQAKSWTLAGRTATVNMIAQSVLFERAAT